MPNWTKVRADITPLKTSGYMLLDATPILDQVPASAGGSATFAYITVASNDASAAIKASSNYVCNGSDDQIEIRAAMLAMQALIDDVSTSINGGEIVLSAGVFNISALNQIDVPQNTTLRGYGGGTFGSSSGTTLKYVGTAPAAPSAGNSYLISAMVRFLGNSSLSRINGQNLRDIGFNGNNVANVVGLYIHWSNAWHLDNLRFYDCTGYGIYIVGGSDGTVKRVRFDYCGSSSGTTDATIRAALEMHDDVGSWANDNIVIDSCWWEQCKDRAVTVRRTNTFGDTNTGRDQVPYAITFINCKFENASEGAGLGVRGGVTNVYMALSGAGIRVLNCYFFLGSLLVDSSVNRMDAAIKAFNYYGVWIKDNQFSHNLSSPKVVPAINSWILLATGEGAIVTGNRFEGGTSPAVAQVTWTGTNTRAQQAGNYISPNNDPSNVRVLTSGSPTTYAAAPATWA